MCSISSFHIQNTRAQPRHLTKSNLITVQFSSTSQFSRYQMKSQVISHDQFCGLPRTSHVRAPRWPYRPLICNIPCVITILLAYIRVGLEPCLGCSLNFVCDEVKSRKKWLPMVCVHLFIYNYYSDTMYHEYIKYHLSSFNIMFHNHITILIALLPC